jgi:hypothetical protein
MASDAAARALLANHTPRGHRMRLLASASVFLITACAAAPHPVHQMTSAPGAEQAAFWSGLRALCGSAFEGTAIHVPPTDSAFVNRRLVMHVSECRDTEIHIPFHVGEDRSRTWVVRRTPGGLELKHIHRYEDGRESANTNYGGTAAEAGTTHRQEFPADAVSVAAVPGRVTQWWFLEHNPGAIFAYGLFRAETGMHYRIEFDLTRPVPTPPPAWR